MAGLNKAIILYSASDEITTALSELSIPIISVPTEQYRLPLAVILGKRKPAPAPSAYDCGELEEPMAVIHGIRGKELDRVLDAMRGSISLKAVTTPMNINWNATLLYRNLSRERAALNSK